MAIANKLTTINTALGNIKKAIISKGIIPSGDITTYSTAISNIVTQPLLKNETFTQNGTYTVAPESHTYTGLTLWDYAIENYTGDIPLAGNSIWPREENLFNIQVGSKIYNGQLVKEEHRPNFNEQIGTVNSVQMCRKLTTNLFSIAFAYIMMESYSSIYNNEKYYRYSTSGLSQYLVVTLTGSTVWIKADSLEQINEDTPIYDSIDQNDSAPDLSNQVGKVVSAEDLIEFNVDNFESVSFQYPWGETYTYTESYNWYGYGTVGVNVIGTGSTVEALNYTGAGVRTGDKVWIEKNGLDYKLVNYYDMDYTYDFTVAGYPTINNETRIVSGFSTSNYIQAPNVFDPSTNNWTFDTKIKTGNDVTTNQIFVATTQNAYCNLALSVMDGKFHLFLSSDGTSWDLANGLPGNITVETETEYWLRLEYNGEYYLLSYSLDGITFTGDILAMQTGNVGSFTPVFGVWAAVSAGEFFGEIDLSYTVFKIGNIIDWTPQFIQTKKQKLGELDNTGNVTINSNFVASGFSDNKYLGFQKTFDSENNPWEISLKFTTSDNVTSAQNIFQLRQINSAIGIDFGIFNNGLFEWGFSFDGTSWSQNIDGSHNVLTLTTYNVKIGWDGEKYYLDYKKEGDSNYTRDIQYTSTTPVYLPLTNAYIGIYDTDNDNYIQPFLGSIDLKECSIKIVNKIWWRGTEDVLNIGPDILTGTANANMRVNSKGNVYIGNVIQPTLSSLNITPSGSAQTYNSMSVDGYKPVTVAAVSSAVDQNILAGNIKYGVSILGVTGNYTGELTIPEYTCTNTTGAAISQGDVVYIASSSNLSLVQFSAITSTSYTGIAAEDIAINGTGQVQALMKSASSGLSLWDRVDNKATVVGFFTDGNGTTYAVCVADAQYRTSSLQWSTINEETLLPNYGSKESAYAATESATYNVDTINMNYGLLNYPAFEACHNQTLTYNGTTYYGALPNCAELQMIKDVSNNLDSLDPTVSSYPSMNLTNWRFDGNNCAWASTEVNRNYAWRLDYGDGCYAHPKDQSYFCAIPIFEIPVPSQQQ